jgi:hypothetical protein
MTGNNVLIYRNLEFDKNQILERRREPGFAGGLNDQKQACSFIGFR